MNTDTQADLTARLLEVLEQRAGTPTHPRTLMRLLLETFGDAPPPEDAITPQKVVKLLESLDAELLAASQGARRVVQRPGQTWLLADDDPSQRTRYGDLAVSLLVDCAYWDGDPRPLTQGGTQALHGLVRAFGKGVHQATLSGGGHKQAALDRITELRRMLETLPDCPLRIDAVHGLGCYVLRASGSGSSGSRMRRARAI